MWLPAVNRACYNRYSFKEIRSCGSQNKLLELIQMKTDKLL